MDTLDQQFLSLVNGERARHGLASVTFDLQLDLAAQRHANDMAHNDWYHLGDPHLGSDGSTLGMRVQASGYQYQRAVENIGAGQFNPQEVFQDWINSPAHLANILNPHVTNMGVGHVFLANDTGNNNFFDYWTVVLGNRVPGTAPPLVTTPPVTTPPITTPPVTTPPVTTPPVTTPPITTPPITTPPVTTPPVTTPPVTTPPVTTPPVTTPPVTTPPVTTPPVTTPPITTPPVTTPPVTTPPVTTPPITTPQLPLITSPTVNSLSIVGTPNDDILKAGPDTKSIAGGLGHDKIIGNDRDNVLRGDLSQRDSGGRIGGNDSISGGAGNDRIGGKGGNDTLLGGLGDDLIWGDDGDDLLRGGLGNDTLTGDDFSGGKGADIFVLAAGEGQDTITDFEVRIDSIGLADGLTFTDISLGQSANATLISADGEVLAQLNHVIVTDLTSDMFVLV